MIGFMLALSVTAWNVTEKKSELDGRTSYTALLEADGTVSNIIDRAEKPVLGVTCNKDGYYATIDWPDFIRADYSETSVIVEWKLDDGPVQRGSWRAADRIVALVGNRGKEWFHSISAGKRLVVRVPDKHGGQEAVFTLAGIGDIDAKAASLSCG